MHKLDLRHFKEGTHTLTLSEESSHFLPENKRFWGLVRGDLVLTKNGNEVGLEGKLTCEVELECSRCLTLFSFPLVAELDLFFLPGKEKVSPSEKEIPLNSADLKLARYEPPELDLTPFIREAILLALPMKPLCHEACLGLCPKCGGDLNLGMCECKEEEDARSQT